MNREEIDKVLLGTGAEALEAHIGIVNMQKDSSTILKTGHKPLDDALIGGANNKIICLGSRPGMGKTFLCSAIIKHLLDSTTTKVKILRMNLEMPTQALLLRELKITLDKKLSEILASPFSEEDKPKVTEVVKKFRDPRVINFSQPVEGDSLIYLLNKFIEIVNTEDALRNDGVKTRKIILVDHLHIYSDKTSIDAVLKVFNSFKMLDPNITFILFFQLNRTVEDLWRDSKEKKVNPRNMFPNSGHIYQTDLLMQYADIVMGLVIPQVVDCEEFAAVHKERNAHLEEHFIPDDGSSNYARLKGWNRIYYNFIKIRMVDDFDDPRIFCNVLNSKYEEAASKLYSPATSTVIKPPTFEKDDFSFTDRTSQNKIDDF